MGERRERGEGAFRWKRKRAEVRLYLGEPYGRKAFLLTPAITNDAQAEERAALLAGFAARLRTAGRIPLALLLLERLAAGEGPRDVKKTSAAIEAVLAGTAAELPTDVITFGELTERWTSGELARLYPDHVREKDTAGKDAQRYESYLKDTIGPVPLVSFNVDHAQHAMRQLPGHLAPATRRQIAQLIRRVLALAVFPVRVIAANPIPRGFLPHTGDRKAMTYVYPKEDAALLACATVALAFRVLYGFLAREGMRVGEALALEWSDVDLSNGAVTLAKNKTNDPRMWALRPDVVRALKAWRAWQEARGILGARVFVDAEGVPMRVRSEQLQAHLRAAGVTRSALFERDAERQPIRVHDLRATFVTLALANGSTEAQISDRTGHKSSAMINRYRRAARSAAELHLGDLAPLDTAIPELAPAAGSEGGAAPDGAEGGPDDGAPSAAGASGSARGPAVASEREERPRLRRARQFARVRRRSRSARRFENPRVGGSIPSLGTDSNSAEAFGFEAHESAAPNAERSEAGPKRAPSVPGAAPGPAGRGDAIGRLAGMLASLAAAGDLDGARALHETIGRLLGPAPAPGEGAAVVDLDAERKRRAGR